MDAFAKVADVRRETLEACPACSSASIKTDLEPTKSLDNYGLSRCEACDLVFTNPRPIREDIPKLYDDREAGMDLGTDGKIIFAMKSAKIRGYVRLLLKMAGVTGEFTMLDAGCGDGMIARVFSEFPNCTLAAGADFHSDAPPLFNAPKMAYRPYETISELGKFDIIVLRHVVEHVADTNEFLDSFRPLLKPNGCLFIEVPDYRSTWRKLFGEHYNQLVIPFHLFHFTPETLKSSVRNYTIEKVVGADVPVIGPSLGRVLGLRVGNIGLAAAALFPPQVIFDAVTGNHTALLALARPR